MARVPLLLLPLLTALSAPAYARGGDVSPQDLRRHIEMLASDDFQGRKPGTEGETRTLAYIAGQMQAIGLKPGAADGSWYQPVPLLERRSGAGQSAWTAAGKALQFHSNNLVMIGSDAVETLRDAPVWFAGHGVRLPERNIDQLAGADLKDAVVLILYDAPENVERFPSFAERVRAVAATGAAAVIGIVGEDVPWSDVVEGFAEGQTRLDDKSVPPIQGAMPLAAATRLLADAGGSLDALLNSTNGPAFRAQRLELGASLDVRTDVRRYQSYNVVGRLEGRAAAAENVLLLAHWDHLGICRAEGDRICNGAVDNASGIAMLLEAARRLAAGPALPRSFLFLATTAEEVGLLGARQFAANPPVPLASIVAAVNMDTVAIAPAGQPVAMIGRGRNGITPLVDAAARALGRQVDSDLEADALIRRQDGWPLDEAGIPTVMAGGSISDLARLGTFLSGIYHKPGDDLSTPLVLDGAAEDTELLVELGRRLADPAQYRP